MATKQRVYVVTHTYPPEIGAAPARLASLSEALQSAGFQVTVLTGMPHYPFGRIFPNYIGHWFEVQSRNGLAVRRHWVIPDHSRSPWRRFLSMFSLSCSVWWSMPRLLLDRPKWVIAQSPPMWLPLVAWLFARLSGARFLLNVSDLWPQALADLGKIREGGWAYRLLGAHERFLFARADAFMVQSLEIQEYIHHKAAKNVPSQKAKELLLFRTGTDTAAFAPKTHFEVGQRFRLVYVGVLGVAHGLLPFCQEIIAQLPDFELDIYGEGSERKRLEAWLEQAEVHGTRCLPPIAPEQVPSLLPTYDAGLLVQYRPVRGTVPSKLYDYLAAGLPVVYVGGGETADLIRQMGCGVVIAPQGPEQVCRQLTDFQQLPEHERAEMGKRGRAAAEQQFDRTLQHQRLIEWMAKH